MHSRRPAARYIGRRGAADLREGELLGFAGHRLASSEGDDAVVFRMRGGGVNRCTEAAVLAFEVAFRDPTGPAAEPSNRDPDLAAVEELRQLL